MKVAQNMSFFIPHTRTKNYEDAYEAIKGALKYQMGWSVTDRRIQSLTYISGGKKLTATVGELGQVESLYEVVAILEAALYVIATKSQSGMAGPTFLIDTKDVTTVRDFEVKAGAARKPLLAAF